MNFYAVSLKILIYCRVLASVLSSKYLHTEIREKGGAYGGGATAGRFIHLEIDRVKLLDYYIEYVKGSRISGCLSKYLTNRCMDRNDSPL